MRHSDCPIDIRPVGSAKPVPNNHVPTDSTDMGIGLVLLFENTVTYLVGRLSDVF